MNTSDGAQRVIWSKSAGVKLDPSITPITIATRGLSLVGPATGRRITAAMIFANIAPSIHGKGRAVQLKMKPDITPRKSARQIFAMEFLNQSERNFGSGFGMVGLSGLFFKVTDWCLRFHAAFLTSRCHHAIYFPLTSHSPVGVVRPLLGPVSKFITMPWWLWC